MENKRKFFKAGEAMAAELFAATVNGEVHKRGSDRYTLELIFANEVLGNLGNEYVVTWKEEAAAASDIGLTKEEQELLRLGRIYNSKKEKNFLEES